MLNVELLIEVRGITIQELTKLQQLDVTLT